jgi:GR25 family glycosyltransferase involved in LPS biosynthesis
VFDPSSLTVINLDRTPERLAKFGRRNGAHTAIRRFPAVDGATLRMEDLIARGLITAKLELTSGALGNALSHLALWRASARDGAPATVCEDDATLSPRFTTAAARVLAALPPDWDIIFWGWNLDASLIIEIVPGLTSAVLHTDQLGIAQTVATFAQATTQPKAFPLKRACGPLCYSISPAGADRLARFLTPLRPVMVPMKQDRRTVAAFGLDPMISRLLPKMKACVAVPPMALSENDHQGSTVVGPAQPHMRKVKARR